MNTKHLYRLQNIFKKDLGIISAWFLLLVLAACSPTASPDPQPVATLPFTPLATQVAQEPTPTVAEGTAVSPTNTPQPTETMVETAVPPTATAVAATVITVQPMPIVFAPGEISTTLNHTLAVGQNDVYTFWAAANQFAEISIISNNNNANFSLVGLVDGQPYKRFENENRSWSGTLLSSGDYQLTVTSLARPIDYTLMLTIYPQEQALPQTLPELAAWVGQQRHDDSSAQDVQQTLSANGFLADWREVDLTGDGVVEWVAILQQDTGSVFGPEGEPIVVSPAGLVYRYYAKFVNDGDWLLTIEHIGDLTGDGLPEVVIMRQFCGAHTCNHAYDIVGAPNGTVQSLVPATAQYPQPVISMMSGEATFVDRTGDGVADLVQHGGFISSAGAGPYQRGTTEVWSWQPAQNQFALAETILDPSNYRFHLLYEANDLFAAGDYAAAIPKYVDVVENPNLDDGVGLIIQESTYDASRQFAAFRLMIAYLQLGDMDNATVWSGWLYNNYPNAHITEGVVAFWEDYNFNHSAALGCIATTNVLQTFPNPTGPLADLGYALPSLTAESVCPVQ